MLKLVKTVERFFFMKIVLRSPELEKDMVELFTV